MRSSRLAVAVVFGFLHVRTRPARRTVLFGRDLRRTAVAMARLLARSTPTAHSRRQAEHGRTGGSRPQALRGGSGAAGQARRTTQAGLPTRRPISDAVRPPRRAGAGRGGAADGAARTIPSTSISPPISAPPGRCRAISARPPSVWNRPSAWRRTNSARQRNCT